MKKHKQSINRWFETKNRKQIAFTSSVILIGILFVVAIVSILVKEGPSANTTADTVGRLTKQVTVNNGQLSYLFHGNNKTKPTNNVNVLIKKIPVITETSRQGVTRANEITKLGAATVLVKTEGGASLISTPLAASATVGVTGTQIKSSFDSDDLRNKVNATNAKIVYIYCAVGYLCEKTAPLADPSAATVAARYAGNFVDTADSKDVIDEADAAKCGPNFKLAVTAANEICDVNYDKQIDESDSAIWGPNFRKTGATR